MADTVEQIRQKIAKLQAKEEALLAQEVDGVVARIQEAIAYYKLTPERLFGAPANSAKAAKKVGATRVATRVKAGPQAAAPPDVAAERRSVKGIKVPAKYKDEEGKTWSGRGSQPRWLTAAIAAGKRLEDFTA